MSCVKIALGLGRATSRTARDGRDQRSNADDAPHFVHGDVIQSRHLLDRHPVLRLALGRDHVRDAGISAAGGCFAAACPSIGRGACVSGSGCAGTVVMPSKCAPFRRVGGSAGATPSAGAGPGRRSAPPSAFGALEQGLRRASASDCCDCHPEHGRPAFWRKSRSALVRHIKSLLGVVANGGKNYIWEAMRPM